MRKFAAVVSLTVCLAVWACFAQDSKPEEKPTFDSLAGKMLARINELNAVLKDVSDEASAKAAVPRIKAIQAYLLDVGKQMNALGKPTTQQSREIEDKYGKDGRAAATSLAAEMQRIAGDLKLAEAKKALDEMTRALQETFRNME